jgi:hypothetical protein
MRKTAVDRARTVPALLCVSLALSACGGGGGGGASGNNPDSPAPPALTITSDTKQLIFEWSAVPGATHYRLQRNPDGASGFTQVGAYAQNATRATLDIAVHRHDWVNARYRLEACNADRCSASGASSAIDAMVQAIGYFKASNTDPDDEFGSSIALSADGRTLAVGAVGEASTATGVDGGENSNAALGSGAVYVFVREGAQWSQQAYLKASNTEGLDWFGFSLALSADGQTLAVGAELEDSNGADGDQVNNAAPNSGAVYVFTRDGARWSQQAYVKAFNAEAGDFFGGAIALSADGHTLAVGAELEDSNAAGVDGDQNNNTAPSSGAVYVFTREEAQWFQQAYVKGSNTEGGDCFGSAVALSADGNTLAVGAELEDSNTAGVDGDENDNTALSSGAVYVFTRAGAQWSQQAYVKAFNTQTGDAFGGSIALSADGHTLAVGAELEDSSAAGVDGDENNNAAPSSGAAYVFTREQARWFRQAYVKASNPQAGDRFGRGVALSADGHTLAVGASEEACDAIGVNSNVNNNGAPIAGAVYTFTRAAAAWQQQAYVKASNTDAFDTFGNAVALSADGDILAVGASFEQSDTTGVNGGQTNNDADNAGAVYLY